MRDGRHAAVPGDVASAARDTVLWGEPSGRALSWGNRMSHLSTTVRVEASAEVVYDIVADPARGPEWQTLVSELGEVSGRPGGVGSSLRRLLPRRRATASRGRFVVTAAERPTLHQAAGTTRGGWARWTTKIEPVSDGECAVHVSLEYELPGEIVGSLFGLLTGNRLEQEFRRTYANLKRVAEEVSAPPNDVEGHRSGLRRLLARRPPWARSRLTPRVADRDSRPDAGRPCRRRGERQVDVRGPPLRRVGDALVRCLPGDPDRRRRRPAGDEDQRSRSSIAR